MLEAPELAWCTKLLNTLASSRHEARSMFFQGPVKPLLTPDQWECYEKLIASPKDLGTIRAVLAENNTFNSVNEFLEDVNMCFDNAICYNTTRYPNVAHAAEALKKVVATEYGKYQKAAAAVVAKAEKASAPALVKTVAPKKIVETVIFVPQCIQILGVLTALDETQLFRDPVTEGIAPGYLSRIDHPMDFGTIRSRLDDGKISTPSDFALCTRRVFANCFNWNFRLRGNDGAQGKAIREQAKKILFVFEDGWRNKFPDISPMFVKMKECIAVIDELLRLPSVTPSVHSAMVNFMYPLPKYFGDFPAGYLDVIPTPMDMATVTSNVVEAKYTTPAEFKRDVSLIFSNCEKWMHAEGGYYDAELEQDSKALKKKFLSLYESLVANSTKRKSVGGDVKHVPEVGLAAPPPSAAVISAVVKKKVVEKLKTEPIVSQSPIVKPKSSYTGSTSTGSVALKPIKIVLKEKYASCVEKIKDHFINCQIGKIYTADYFLKAVDPTKYADYAELIQHPMNLTMIEKKIRSDRYPTFCDILKDAYLIRHNTYLYNTGTAGLEIRILVDHVVNNFSFLLTLTAKNILRMYDLAIEPGSNVAAAIKSNLEAAVSAITPDFMRLIQVYHGTDPEATAKGKVGKGKSGDASESTDIYASIPDEFFVQPFPDGISHEYLRPAAPTAEILSALNSFYKYDPETLTLVEAEAEASISAPTPIKGSGGARRQSSSSSAMAVVEAVEPEPDYYATQPSGKSAGKGGKKRRRESNNDYIYGDEYLAAEAELISPPAVAVPEDTLDIIVSVARPPSEWEQSCLDILKKILKHEFIDIAKAARAGNMVVNFMSPIVTQFPEIEESYLELIDTPMDFSIIGARLEDHGFLDSEDFYEKMVLVFQNAIDYNRPHMDEGGYAAQLVPRCLHLIRFVRWMCLELLPTADDTDVAEPEALGMLRKSIVLSERQERVSLLRSRRIDSTKECMSLIKKFDHKKSAREYSYFSVPVNLKDVPNYSTFVRKPMDFSTVKEKLEDGRYESYMAFIEDIQLIFANAKKFNGAFREHDEFSQTIYNAATMFEERLDNLLHKEFSIEVLERVLWNDIRYAEDEKSRVEHLQIMEKQRLEDEAIRDKEIARLRAIDPTFAMDQDRELKRKHALDGGLSETARKTMGLFSENALSLPTPEEREANMLELARRRDNLFEAGWKKWGVRSQPPVASMSVGDMRLTSLDNLAWIRSPQKLRASMSHNRLPSFCTDGGDNAPGFERQGTLTEPGELTRLTDSAALNISISKVLTAKAKKVLKRRRFTALAIDCFSEFGHEEGANYNSDTMPLMEVDCVIVPDSLGENRSSLVEMEIADDVTDESAGIDNEDVELTDTAVVRGTGCKVHRIRLNSTAFDVSLQCFVIVVEYRLSSGVSLCRIFTPCNSSSDPSAESAVRIATHGDLVFTLNSSDAVQYCYDKVHGGIFSLRRKISPVNRALQLSNGNPVKETVDDFTPLSQVVCDVLNCDERLYPFSGGMDVYPRAISLGSSRSGLNTTKHCGSAMSFLLQPYILRVEGSRKCSGAQVQKMVSDELLFRVVVNEVPSAESEDVCIDRPVAHLNHPIDLSLRGLAGSDSRFIGLADHPFQLCKGPSSCLVSSVSNCVSIAAVVNIESPNTQHRYLQHWVVVSGKTELAFAIPGYENASIDCGV